MLPAPPIRRRKAGTEKSNAGSRCTGGSARAAASPHKNARIGGRFCDPAMNGAGYSLGFLAMRQAEFLRDFGKIRRCFVACAGGGAVFGAYQLAGLQT